MPMVGNLMVQQNVSLPRAFGNLDKHVSELLIRSYGAAWMFITDEMSGENWFTTSAQMAIPTSRANVLWWRGWRSTCCSRSPVLSLWSCKAALTNR